jgi:hypothetical protein
MATPGALNAFAATDENPINYIVRHMNPDPGALGADDELQNLRAVRGGMRVFSAYELRNGTRIRIITGPIDRRLRSCCPRNTDGYPAIVRLSA